MRAANEIDACHQNIAIFFMQEDIMVSPLLYRVSENIMLLFALFCRGIAKIIQAHVHPVCSLTWSRTGRKLVSASALFRMPRQEST